MITLFKRFISPSRALTLRVGMRALAIILLTAFNLSTSLTAQAADATPNRKIVAYVTSWSSITPDPSVMTHINYAFGGVGNDYRSVYADNVSRLQQIVKLKEKNPNLKVLLSVGGWGRGNFSPMAGNADNRKAFAQACAAFCTKYKLDGIDIDWEFPGNNSSNESSPSNEKQNYTLLMRDLREALGSQLLLTMASSADPGYYDFRNCMQYLDFVNVMTYDMASPPNHHSALFRGGTVGNGWIVMDESIKKHLNAGIPREKLVMGLAFYGNSGAGSQISLQEIEDGIKSGKWTDHWDDVAKVPYVTDANGKFAYGYDNARSLQLKCEYIKNNNLAGGMYWEYANDNNAGTERSTVYQHLNGNDGSTSSPTDEDEDENTGFMHAVGQKIVDPEGHEFILHGHAPGGWMIQEPYMMETSDFTSSAHTIRQKIESVLSPEDTEEFYRRWLDNGFRRDDVKLLAELGFNSIRLPLHYRLFTLPIEEEPVKGQQTWREEGFRLVDNVLEWCKEMGIYLILDMHGAPGGQGYDSAISDYDFTKPSLWESEENKTKLIALWTKLAERYANERYIGGYDLLNEPNWAFDGNNVNGCDENTNTPIWNIYKRLINAIRAVDKVHMLILEGNCWCNNFNGLPNIRNWDTNLCLEFHKYWTVNDLGSIQFILNLRSAKNLPIWCGESGENSNKWSTDAVRLLEDNGIGWSWWTWKKIGSVNGICTVKAPAGYDALKKYWAGSGSKPSADAARRTLFALADAYLLENCTVNRAVADALLRQPHSDELVPFASNKVPGTVYAPDYDLGRCGVAYMDLDGVETTHTTGGDYTAWNQGWAYRADGVDIETCKDVASNGYSVGWTLPGEWMKYTIDVEQTAAYRLVIRYASSNAKTTMAFEVDGAAIAPEVTLGSSGGWDTWKTDVVKDVVLSAGRHVLKVTTLSGGANLASFAFNNPADVNSVPFKAIAATTSEDGRHIVLSVNRDVTATPSASDFSVKSDGGTVGIASVKRGASEKCIDIVLSSAVYRDNVVTLSYNGTSVKNAEGAVMPAFSDMKVTNVAEACAQIPGRINVEDYDAQNGLTFEKCEDSSGGSTNFGYTDPGDYVDFLVNIREHGEYTFQYRTAAMYAGGKFEVQLFPPTGGGSGQQKTVVGQYSVGATGGWQTWTTTTAKAVLPKGVFRMRIYIVNKEFNMNWFSFSNPVPVEGIEMVKGGRFSVHPNPCHGTAHVDTSTLSGEGTIAIYSMAGAQVYRHTHEMGGIVDVDLHALPHGNYILRLTTGASSYSQKIIVE